jgi:uncharacterized protein (DUF486 family)
MLISSRQLPSVKLITTILVHVPFSFRPMAQGSTQPLTEMSTKNISWGLGLTDYHLHVPIVLKSGSLNHLEP